MQSCLGTLILPYTAGAPRLWMCYVLALKCSGCGVGLQLIALTELADEKKGYVVDDTLVLEARLVLLEDMESMDGEEVTFDVRGKHFSVLKSSLQVRCWVRAGVCTLHLRLGLTHSPLCRRTPTLCCAS